MFNNETWISAQLVHHAQTLRGCLDFSYCKITLYVRHQQKDLPGSDTYLCFTHYHVHRKIICPNTRRSCL